MTLSDLRQIWVTAKASLKVRYRQSFAGIIWVILNPLLLLTVQSIAFKMILKIEVDNYLIFLSSGLLPWIFFVQTLEMSCGTLVNAGRLLRAYPLRPFVLVGAQFADNTINFLIGFLLVTGLGLTWGKMEWTHLPLAVPGLLFLGIGTFSLALLGSLVQVFFRDFKFILGFLMQLLFFLTPVFYPSSFVPPSFQWLIDVNFIYHWIRPIREALLEGVFVPEHLFISALSSLVVAMISFFAWRWRKNEIYQYL
ncbi:MAG: ABC transporter permease [Bdellovibrio sp.]|nr:ABC transporter permease [Bdellovibrio sp.]